MSLPGTGLSFTGDGITSFGRRRQWISFGFSGSLRAEGACVLLALNFENFDAWFADLEEVARQNFCSQVLTTEPCPTNCFMLHSASKMKAHLLSTIHEDTRAHCAKPGSSVLEIIAATKKIATRVAKIDAIALESRNIDINFPIAYCLGHKEVHLRINNLDPEHYHAHPARYMERLLFGTKDIPKFQHVRPAYERFSEGILRATLSDCATATFQILLCSETESETPESPPVRPNVRSSPPQTPMEKLKSVQWAQNYINPKPQRFGCIRPRE